MSRTEAEIRQQLEGRWSKTAAQPCSETYPSQLEFLANGTYRGRKGSGEFTVWDAGSWEIVDQSQIKISTANDAVIAYRYSLGAGTLTFIDDEGCEFSYRREAT
jgi:hypothetical protein